MTSPFADRIADPWNPALIDLPSLNHAASDALAARLLAVRERATRDSGTRAEVFLVLGPAGAGKTHLFARLRRSAGIATLVYVRPEIGADATPRALLTHAIDALAHKGVDGESTQLELLIGSALGVLCDERRRFPSLLLEELRALDAPSLDKKIDAALDRAEALRTDLELTWLDRLLRTAFCAGRDRRALLRWLAGRDPDVARAAPHLPSIAVDEASVIPSLRTLAFACSLAAPLVVVFDQLENLVDAEHTTARVRAHARLVAELHDAVANVTVVQLALDGEWLERIRPILATSERARVEQNVLTLSLPTAEQRRALVRLRFEAFAEAHPSFSADELPDPSVLDSVCETPGLTPRALFALCERVIAGDPFEPPRDDPHARGARRDAHSTDGRDPTPPAGAEPSLDGDDPLAVRFATLVREAERTLDQHAREGLGVDRNRLSSALRVLLRRALPGGLAEPTARETFVSRWESGGYTRHLYVLQSDNGRSFAAMVKHALAHAEQSFVLALRADGWAPPSSWKTAVSALGELSMHRRVKLVELSRGALAKLFALHDLVAAVRSGDVSDVDGTPLSLDVAEPWITSTLDLCSWEPAATLLALTSTDLEGPASASKTRANNGAKDRGAAPSEIITAKPLAPALRALATLRVASIDRLTQAARALEPEATRASVVQSLEQARALVRWVGSSLVAIRSRSES